MARLNLTLDEGTEAALGKHARRHGLNKATLARQLITEALRRREDVERREKLERDYSEGRDDQAALLADMEAAQPLITGELPE